MKTTLTLTLAVLLAGTALVPNAAADDDPPQCGFYPCDCTLGTIGCIIKEFVAAGKRFVDENDPRDWPCTCDPMPEPLGP